MRSLLLLLPIAACAPDLRREFPFDGALPGADHIAHQPQDDGSTISTVDASNKASTVYFDLDTGRELEAGEALDTQDWDLGFQRFKVSGNGGGGGPGVVRIAPLKGVDFEALTVAPAEGYQQDAAETVFNAFDGGWYFYDLGKHKLITREDLLFVVQSSEGAYFKVKMLSYYDAAGTAAKPSLRWAPIASP